MYSAPLVPSAGQVSHFSSKMSQLFNICYMLYSYTGCFIVHKLFIYRLLCLHRRNNNNITMNSE